MKKIRKCLHLFWLYLTRPYPFQLWVAPRKKRWCFAPPEAEPKLKSPPGFSFEGTEYAMYLYPDSISMYWWIYFLSSVCLHAVLDIIFVVSKHAEICTYKYTIGAMLFDTIGAMLFVTYHYLIPGSLFFAISHYLIYSYSRISVLDDLWPSWPDTQCQREYFKNICSRINFASRDDFKKYGEKYDIYSLNRYKSICYFNRPVFFNPRGSIQEGMLRAAIADFFSDKKKFIKNIFIYYIPHVWISFIYLLLNLLAAFRWHPYDHQNETIPLVILIVVWAVVSVPILFKQYISIKLFYDYDKKLFKFSPKIVEHLFKQKMQINNDLVNSLDPKKTFSLLHGFAFGSYLVILNLVMQYANPHSPSPETETNKPAIEQNIKNECKQVLGKHY